MKEETKMFYCGIMSMILGFGFYNLNIYSSKEMAFLSGFLIGIGTICLVFYRGSSEGEKK